MTIKRWIPFALFCTFFTGIVVGADSGKLKWFLEWIGTIPLGDKVGHVFLIGTLSFLLNAALNWRTITVGPQRIQLGGLIILVVMTLEEFSQIWFPGRSFDLRDLAANYIGIFIAELLARRLFARSLDRV